MGRHAETAVETEFCGGARGVNGTAAAVFGRGVAGGVDVGQFGAVEGVALWTL